MPDRSRTSNGGSTHAMNENQSFIAAVKYIKDGNEFECVGIIVTDYKVLTPAHCVHKRNSVKVEFGILNSTRAHYTEKASLANITLHPKYVHGQQYYDIAVIEFERKITSNSQKVDKARMVEDNYVMETETKVSLLGYGKKDDRLLYRVDSRISDYRKCMQDYLYQRMVTISHAEFCVDIRIQLSSNARFRGGPIMLRGTNKLIGMYSFAYDTHRLAKVSTRIPGNRKFIDNPKVNF